MLDIGNVLSTLTCANPESFEFDNVFLSYMMRGGRFHIPLYAGYHRPTVETPFIWRFAGVLMVAQHQMLAC